MVTHRSLVAGPCSSHLLTLCQNGKQGSDTKRHQTSSRMACSEPRSGNLAVLFVNCLPWNCGASLRAILILSVFPAYKTIITLVTTIPTTSSSSSLAPFAPQLQQPLCAFVALAGKYFPGDCFRERSPSDDFSIQRLSFQIHVHSYNQKPLTGGLFPLIYLSFCPSAKCEVSP